MVAKDKKIYKDDLFVFAQVCQWYSMHTYDFMHQRLAKSSNYILEQIRVKLARKALTNLPKNGYRFKLNEAEINLIYFLRNDCLVEITAYHENSLVKFI
jgi:hypothetical protein